MQATPKALVPQIVPAGAAYAFIKQTHDIDGILIANATPLMIPEVTEIDMKDMGEIKEVKGSGAYPIALVSGSRKVDISITVSALYGAMLNALYFGKAKSAVQRHVHVDTVGRLIDNDASATIAIQQTRTFNIGRWDSATSVVYSVDLSAVTHTVSAGKYTFSAADAGKAVKITYDSNGVAIVTNVTIPASLTFNVTRCSTASYAVRKNATNLTNGVTVTRTAYSMTSVPAGSTNYMATLNGIVVLNSAFTMTAATNLAIDHTTDGVRVTSTIALAEIPAAAYTFYVDPASDALFIGDLGVDLVTDSGTAMTGVSAGDPLTKVSSGTPLTGEYKSDAKGFYTFAAADVADKVKISYNKDYASFAVSLHDDATFNADLGVITQGGMPLTRVAYSSPLSISTNQYYVNEDTGVYFFDSTNAGDRFFINFAYDELGGNSIEVKNTPAGTSPTFELILHQELDGEKTTAFYPKCKCKGVGYTLKHDPTTMKFDIEAFADRVTKIVCLLSTSA